MNANAELDADGDVTILGGEAGQALPFDPRALAPLARRETTVLAVGSALPFAVGAAPAARYPAAPAEPTRIRTTPAWVGMHADPTRKEERPPASIVPGRPLMELERAAQEGAAAASTAALAPAGDRPQKERIKLLADEPPADSGELVEVLYAPNAALVELRRASTGACCGGLHVSSKSTSSHDPRRAARHAMSHAALRSADELSHELGQALRGGAPPPVAVVSGVLSVAFDESAAFRVTLALASVFLRSEPQHAELLAHASRLDEVAENLPDETLAFMRGRLEEALRRTSKSSQLELSRDRCLLERRSIATSEVLGGRRLRASLRSGAGRDIPCFLPVEAGSHLPFSRSFQSILVATVHVSPDAAGPVCLDAHSIGRPAGEGPWK